MKRIIFHHPLPLDPNAKSASGIRPQKMIQAFKNIGYEVFVIAGYGSDRKAQIKLIKKQILAGEKFEFVYSESSTQPTLLTERNHIPKFPTLDFGFFKFCKKNNIKIGLFYRDIYWLFSEYGATLHPWKRNLAKLFYRYDLKKYNYLVDVVYLPSMQMAQYIPTIENSKFKALPPGHSGAEMQNEQKSIDVLELLYIGGIGNHYQMHELFEALKTLPNVRFTLCTREAEWSSSKESYSMSENISIVHKSGDKLRELYKKADIAMLYVKPQEYWEFAAPVKLYEYIGERKPVIASKGTLSGSFVLENDIGWNIEYNKEACLDILNFLQTHSDEIRIKKENIQKISLHHTWKARATQVADDLTT